MSVEEKFQAAVRVIHSLPKDGPYQPSNSSKLKFYGLYKQATEGKNTISKPGFWDVIGRAKWEAWNKLGSISKEEAMNQYVDSLKEIVETMSFNGEVEDFLDSIGPFYEFVNLQGNEMNHIKEKLEEVTSSSGSSSANSRGTSAENSKQSSPVKTFKNGNEEGDNEDEISTSETAEVIVETSTATYESKSVKNYHAQNGNPYKMTNGDCNDNAIPPPAPTHSYSHQNGFIRNFQNDNAQDEVLTITTPHDCIPCKEDLEREFNGDTGHSKVKITSSIETVVSVATSGTESEKYYSGDSEPEIDEKYTMSFASNECYPSTSAAALVQMQSNESKAIVSSPSKKSKERVSLKGSSNSRNLNPDVVLQQTVERINRDVDHILARLRILEAAYAANADVATRTPNQRGKRRILGSLSTQSIAFIVMWPFAVHFLMKLLSWWWRRRRNTTRAITY
ncbi:Acyl-CoA-binding domain-containing protein 5 [Orchesella cincta]|uniref:Acyl-CoA-binding domain-containing protein 5 n=1 Tax=Orchesella cincta TaxID=48709 RepID=A0A1D2MPC7_ORCCI|nr:Acyl-CoA-binding domain-containing protein 5 [Orchesella cincta]